MAKHVKADLDDIVFENRERNYGAYFLRKRYPRYLSTALGIVAFLVLFGSFGPLLARSLGWIKAKVEKEEIVVEIDLTKLPPPPQRETINEPPPPPPPPVIKEIKQFDARIPEPSPEPDVEDTTTIHKIEDLVDQNLGFENVDGVEEELPFIPGEEGEPEVIISHEPKLGDWVVVEEEPKPVNINDIKKLVGYPQIARDASIEGQVVVRVLVDKNGRYAKHKVVHQIHPLLAEAVEKHINKLKFTPAIQGGRPIKFWVNIPFNFKLIN